MTLYEAICRMALERIGMAGAWIILTDNDRLAIELNSAVAAVYPEQVLFGKSPGYEATDSKVSRLFQTCLVSGSTSIISLDGIEIPIVHDLAPDIKAYLAAIPMKYGGKNFSALGVISLGEEAIKKEQILLLESYGPEKRGRTAEGAGR